MTHHDRIDACLITVHTALKMVMSCGRAAGKAAFFSVLMFFCSSSKLQELGCSWKMSLELSCSSLGAAPQSTTSRWIQVVQSWGLHYALILYCRCLLTFRHTFGQLSSIQVQINSAVWAQTRGLQSVHQTSHRCSWLTKENVSDAAKSSTTGITNWWPMGHFECIGVGVLANGGDIIKLKVYEEF